MTDPLTLDIPELIRQIADSTDRKLAWQFFVFFSRFEYALKRGPYLKQGIEEAQPNWDKFASDHSEAFELVADNRLANAVAYFKNSPPRKQVRKAGRLDWSDPCAHTNGPVLVWLLRAIRIVRNNLFHGGKFPQFPVSDSSRDRELIENAIIVLSHALRLNSDVKNCFREGIEL